MSSKFILLLLILSVGTVRYAYAQDTTHQTNSTYFCGDGVPHIDPYNEQMLRSFVLPFDTIESRLNNLLWSTLDSTYLSGITKSLTGVVIDLTRRGKIKKIHWSLDQEELKPMKRFTTVVDAYLRSNLKYWNIYYVNENGQPDQLYDTILIMGIKNGVVKINM